MSSLQILSLEQHAIVHSSHGDICYEYNKLDPLEWYSHHGYTNGDCASAGFKVKDDGYYRANVIDNTTEHYSTIIENESGAPLCHEAWGSVADVGFYVQSHNTPTNKHTWTHATCASRGYTASEGKAYSDGGSNSYWKANVEVFYKPTLVIMLI